MAEVAVRVCPSLEALVEAEMLGPDVWLRPFVGDRAPADVPDVLDLGADLTAVSTCGSADVAGCLRCAQTLLPHGAVDSLGDEALPVTRAWLARWAASGFPPVRAARVTARPHLVLLETASGPDPLFRRLADATGWPASIVPASTDHLRLRLERVVAQWRIERMSDALRKARAAATSHMMALEVFGQLATLTSEERVIEQLSELFTVLFGARTLRYTPAAPSSRTHGTHTHEAPARREAGYAVWDAPQAWAETADGFKVRLDYAGRLVGVFELGDFAVPQGRADYTNLALTIAPAAGLAIANARAMHGIIPICAYCKRIRDAKGDWWALEAYLADHTDARFSHGICPTCVREQLVAAGLEPEEESGG